MTCFPEPPLYSQIRTKKLKILHFSTKCNTVPEELLLCNILKPPKSGKRMLTINSFSSYAREVSRGFDRNLKKTTLVLLRTYNNSQELEE